MRMNWQEAIEKREERKIWGWHGRERERQREPAGQLVVRRPEGLEGLGGAWEGKGGCIVDGGIKVTLRPVEAWRVTLHVPKSQNGRL